LSLTRNKYKTPVCRGRRLGVIGEEAAAQVEACFPMLYPQVVLFGLAPAAGPAVFQLRLVDQYWGVAGTRASNAFEQPGFCLYVTPNLSSGLAQVRNDVFSTKPILKRNFSSRFGHRPLALRHDVRMLANPLVSAGRFPPAVAWYAHAIHGALPSGTVTANPDLYCRNWAACS